ncbi:hypothetical protein [Pseudomonas soli]|uniref:hypothetical protein n=1 Tax=Pseudomonas soli TaxID=1306993 RepID=UPI0037FD187F
MVVLAGLSDLAGIGWDKLKDFYGVDPYLSAEEMIPGLEDYYKTAKVVDLTVMGVEAFLNVAGFIAFRRSEGRVNNQRQNEGGDTASNSSVGESLSATTKLIADARANTV